MNSISLLCTTCVAMSMLAQAVDVGAPPGRRVEVGGRKLHVHCTGAGAPTVVLEAGASSFAIDWSLVQPEVARTNRTCSYDRAGHGWSDPGGSRYAGVVTDLRSALEAAGEKPPYVLVGASLGGIYVRLYQAAHPDEVAGMVLVDPSHEDRLFAMFEGRPVLIASLTAAQLRSTIPSGPATVPRRPPQTGAPFDRLPKDLYETRVALETQLIASVPQAVPYETVAAAAEEERAALVTLQDVRTSNEHPLGDRPLIVLTRGTDASDDLKEARARLARISTNSRHDVVPGAGHEIHLFEPRAVVQAVQDVVAAAKHKTRLTARNGY